MNESDAIVAQMEKLSFEDNSSQGLNTALRQRLQEFAQTRNHKFEQDNVGNIYITRAGSDSNLPAIAVTFSLDTTNSSSTLSSALCIFLELEICNTSCGITLLGWSSPQGHSLGHDAWEGNISPEASYEEAAELRQFSKLQDVATFSLSAIFQFVETEEPLVAMGSPVLTEKVRIAAVENVKIEFGGPISRRAPAVSISGKGVNALAKLSIEYYSRYVVGLFENFD